VPPRFAYWTILIDNQPTAFRASDQAELLPTLNQLKRTNPNAQMKWFARGKLWDTPEQAQWAGRNLPKQTERRGRDWRPGGQHKDPRARPKGPRASHGDSRAPHKDSRAPHKAPRAAGPPRARRRFPPRPKPSTKR
jgi:hypothetical protein